MGSNILAWLGATPSPEGEGHIEHYPSILADHLHPILQTVFPGENVLYSKMTMPLYTRLVVQIWLDEHNDEVVHLTWYLQSPDLIIIEPL